ncbi:unnamed protein product [Cunninghamella echinulata]
MYHARACNGFGKGKVGPICSCNTNKTMRECFVKPGQRCVRTTECKYFCSIGGMVCMPYPEKAICTMHINPKGYE